MCVCVVYMCVCCMDLLCRELLCMDRLCMGLLYMRLGRLIYGSAGLDGDGGDRILCLCWDCATGRIISIF